MYMFINLNIFKENYVFITYIIRTHSQALRNDCPIINYCTLPSRSNFILVHMRFFKRIFYATVGAHQSKRFFHLAV